MHRLGYRHNVSASLLARGRSAEIGVFLPRLREPLVAEQAIGISEAAYQYDFHYRFFFNQTDQEYLRFIEAISCTGSSGILTSPVNYGCAEVYEALERYCESGGNVMLINADYQPRSSRMERLQWDDERGGELAAEHLLSCGCRSFRLLQPAYESIYNRRRKCGFLRRLREAGHTAECLPIRARDFHLYQKDDLDKVLASLPSRSVGLFTVNDYLALSLMQRLTACGRLSELGHKLRLVGFDDNAAAASACIPLTTIRHDLQGFGRTAMQRLIGNILGRDEKVKLSEPSLIIRDT